MKPASREGILFLICVAVSVLAWSKFLLSPSGVYLADYLSRLAIIALILWVVGWRPFRTKLHEPIFAAANVFLVVCVCLFADYTLVRALGPSPFLESFHFPPIANPALRWMDAIIGVALVAVHEELVFRYLPARIGQSKNWTAARTYAVSVIAFTLIHVPQGYTFILLAAVFAVLAMYLYCRFDSLWPPIAAHFLIDFVFFSPVGCWLNLRACAS